ncbi:MAG: tetratricopeptide repeat protein, partial [Phycisphaerales bacterium]|nr:tetratricopeptide repeat protein [Phycisphaerales bacterium]
ALAGEVLEQAQKQFPKESFVREAAARRAWQRNDLPAVLTIVDDAEVSLGALSPGLRRWQIAALMALGRTVECRRALETLEAESTSSRDAGDATHRAVIRALRARLDADAAPWIDVQDVYLQALAVAPREPMIQYLLGEGCLRAGELERAEQAFRAATTMDPNWIAAGLAEADALLRLGRSGDALAVAQSIAPRASERDLSASLILVRSILACAHDGILVGGDARRRDDVVEYLQTLNGHLPGNAEIASLLVEAFLAAGRRDDAATFVRTVIAEQSEDAPLLVALTRTSRRLGLGLEAELIAVLGPAALEANADGAVEASALAERGGDRAAALAVLDRARAAATSDAARERLDIERCQVLLRGDDPGASAALASLITTWPNSLTAVSVALREERLWDDADLAARALDRLRSLLGPNAIQVRLGEATRVLRYEADDDARLAEAIVSINGVLEEAPESLAALTLSAEASLTGRHAQPDLAADALRRAVELYPNQVALYPRLIALLQERGDFATADRYLQRLGQVAGTDESVRALELSMLETQGDFEMAHRRAGELAKPDSITDQLVLARLAQRAGRMNDARNLYDRLLATPPVGDAVYAEAAHFHAVNGRVDEGWRLLRAAPFEGREDLRTLMYGLFQQRYGDIAEAERWLRRAVEIGPDEPAGAEALARLLADRQAFDESRQVVLTALRRHPDHVGLRATLALTSLGDGGDPAAALSELRALGADNECLLGSLELFERIERRDGRAIPKPADLDAANQLVAECPRFLPGWRLAMSLHVDGGLLADALQLAERAMTRFPNQPDPAQWAADLQIRLGRIPDAYSSAQEWRRRSMHDPISADVMCAGLLMEMGRMDEAMRTLAPYEARIVAASDRQPAPALLLVQALAHAGRVEDAVRLLMPRLKTDAGWRAQWISAAGTVPAPAARRMLDVVEPLTTDDAVRVLLAGAWNGIGQREGDASVLDRAWRIVDAVKTSDESLRAAAEFCRATICESRRNDADAARRYRAVLDLNPSHAGAMNNLAIVLVRAGTACEEALTLCDGALRLMPDQPDMLDTRAQVLQCLGRYDEARASLERAIAQRPQDVAMRLNLVETMLDQGAFEAAESAMRSAEAMVAADWRPAARDHRDRLEVLRQRLLRARASVDR